MIKDFTHAMSPRPSAAVVLLSGGLDSTTLLYFLRSVGVKTIPVAFDYEQRHGLRELAAARAIDPDTRVLTFPRLRSVDPPIPDGHYADESMKAIVYPNRNMVMLSLAAGIAVDRGAGAVAYGAHAGDHPIYPDCRPAFIEAMRGALAVSNWEPVQLLTPFRDFTKADIVRMGVTLGVPFGLTWSCYKGRERHCGTCGTCVERREAFAIAHVTDPTDYEPLQ